MVGLTCLRVRLELVDGLLGPSAIGAFRHALTRGKPDCVTMSRWRRTRMLIIIISSARGSLVVSTAADAAAAAAVAADAALPPPPPSERACRSLKTGKRDGLKEDGSGTERGRGTGRSATQAAAEAAATASTDQVAINRHVPGAWVSAASPRAGEARRSRSRSRSKRKIKSCSKIDTVGANSRHRHRKEPGQDQDSNEEHEAVHHLHPQSRYRGSISSRSTYCTTTAPLLISQHP